MTFDKVCMSRNVKMLALKIKKHSPEIFIGLGIVGSVVSTVLACKSTTKIDTILNESKDSIEKIHSAQENKALQSEYSEKDARKDLTIVYAQTGIKLIKLYSPAIIVGGLSMTSILTGSNILRKRNMAIAAAYATVDKSYKEYRKRVAERFGEQTEHEIRYNIKAKEFTEIVTNAKGKEKEEKHIVDIADPNQYSDFARIFDCGNIGWTKDPEYNLMFLRKQQAYFNNKLIADGHVFLNDVYKELGFPVTKAGQCVGWVYNKENPVGDNFIDFGIYDINREQAHNFVNGYERSIILDFNVDGNILDLI